MGLLKKYETSISQWPSAEVWPVVQSVAGLSMAATVLGLAMDGLAKILGLAIHGIGYGQ